MKSKTSKLILISALFLASCKCNGAVIEFPFKDTQEVVDQTAHFVLGGGAAFGLTYIVGVFALPAVVGAAYVRELSQHDWKHPQGKGSARDMRYWFYGALIGTTIGVNIQ